MPEEAMTLFRALFATGAIHDLPPMMILVVVLLGFLIAGLFLYSESNKMTPHNPRSQLGLLIKESSEGHPKTNPGENEIATKEPGQQLDRTVQADRREGIRRVILALEWIWASAWMLFGLVVSHSLVSDKFVFAAAIGWAPYLLHRLGAWVLQGFRQSR